MKVTGFEFCLRTMSGNSKSIVSKNGIRSRTEQILKYKPEGVREIYEDPL